MPRCNVNLVKLGEQRSHIKLLDSIPSIPMPVAPVASPITVLPSNKLPQEDDEKGAGRVNRTLTMKKKTTEKTEADY